MRKQNYMLESLATPPYCVPKKSPIWRGFGEDIRLFDKH